MNLDGRQDKFGEGRLQQAFLQRYHYLKVLQIAAYYPNKLSWAVILENAYLMLLTR